MSKCKHKNEARTRVSSEHEYYQCVDCGARRVKENADSKEPVDRLFLNENAQPEASDERDQRLPEQDGDCGSDNEDVAG